MIYRSSKTDLQDYATHCRLFQREGDNLPYRAWFEQKHKISLSVGDSVSLSREDLSNMDLSELPLGCIDFSEANLNQTNFSGANLSGSIFKSAQLQGADLTDANCAGALFNFADLTGANLTRANMMVAEFHHTKLDQTNWCSSYFFMTDLKTASVSGITDLSCAVLKGSQGLGEDFSEVRGCPNFEKAYISASQLESLANSLLQGISAIEALPVKPCFLYGALTPNADLKRQLKSQFPDVEWQARSQQNSKPSFAEREALRVRQDSRGLV